MRTLVLASGSPRRHEILTTAGYAHIVRPAHADETLPDNIAPENAVELLSRRKAEAALLAAASDEIVLSADTVVSLDGRILGKPKDDADAFAMLTALSGRSHAVYTGVTVASQSECLTAYEKTTVHMRPLTRDEIESYIASGDPRDKAGAYGYQSFAGIFISGIEGDYFNVVGLPLCLTSSLLESGFKIVPEWQKR